MFSQLSRLHLIVLLFLCVWAAFAVEAVADDAHADAAQYTDTRYSLSVSAGRTYYPDGKVGVGVVTFSTIFDYDRVWPHRAPEGLRFKVEASAGAGLEPSAKFIGSADMLAVLYLGKEGGQGITPYVEAGIGAIFTDFKRPAQGTRFNFHPVLGAGLEFDGYLVAVRIEHLSNAWTNQHNKSLDYLVLQAGFFF